MLRDKLYIKSKWLCYTRLRSPHETRNEHESGYLLNPYILFWRWSGLCPRWFRDLLEASFDTTGLYRKSSTVGPTPRRLDVSEPLEHWLVSHLPLDPKCAGEQGSQHISGHRTMAANEPTTNGERWGRPSDVPHLYGEGRTVSDIGQMKFW